MAMTLAPARARRMALWPAPHPSSSTRLPAMSPMSFSSDSVGMHAPNTMSSGSSAAAGCARVKRVQFGAGTARTSVFATAGKSARGAAAAVGWRAAADSRARGGSGLAAGELLDHLLGLVVAVLHRRGLH